MVHMCAISEGINSHIHIQFKRMSLRSILIFSCPFLLNYAFLILTIFCNMLSTRPDPAACCIIQLRGRVQQFRMLQLLRSSSFGRHPWG
jgi:hypothetical protein